MTPDKARRLDSFVSPKVTHGRSASAAARPALDALERDARYQRLRAELAREGLLQPAGWAYAWRGAAFAGVIAAAYLGLCSGPSWGVRLACWGALGFASVQGGFLSHEATHGAVSRDGRLVEAIGQFFDTVVVGLAFSYFWRSHELHHYHCNEADLDPDTESSIWSVTDGQAREKRAFGAWMTRHQVPLILALMPLWGFQLKWDSMRYVARNAARTRADQVGFALHIALWFVALPLCVGLSHAIVDYLCWIIAASLYMFAVIPINHVGRAQHEPGAATSFFEQQVSSTRNLGSSALLDFLLMGQNNHIEHHLFPQIPCGRLARVRPLVRAACEAHAIPYREEGYFEAWTSVLRHLGSVAQRAREAP